MLKFWKSLSYTTRFSTIAFIVTGGLGLFSMGALGAALYYPVSFLFKAYPTFNDWHGDWVWPTLIMVGMLWSLGFIFGGIMWHYLQKVITSSIALKIVYGIILWVWAAILWFIIISNNVDPL